MWICKNIAGQIISGPVPFFNKEQGTLLVQALPMHQLNKEQLQALSKTHRNYIADTLFKAKSLIWQQEMIDDPQDYFDKKNYLAYLFVKKNAKGRLKVYGYNAFEYDKNLESIYLASIYRKPFQTKKEAEYKGLAFISGVQAAYLYFQKFPQANNYDVAIWGYALPEAVPVYLKYGLKIHSKQDDLNFIVLSKCELRSRLGNISAEKYFKVLYNYNLFTRPYKDELLFKAKNQSLPSILNEMVRDGMLDLEQKKNFADYIQENRTTLMYMYAGQARKILNEYLEILKTYNFN